MRTRSNISVAYPHAMLVVCPVQFIHVWVNTIVVVCSLSLCDQDSVWKSQFILVRERNMLGELAYGQFLVDFERCSLCQLGSCVIYTYTGKQHYCGLFISCEQRVYVAFSIYPREG